MALRRIYSKGRNGAAVFDDIILEEALIDLLDGRGYSIHDDIAAKIDTTTPDTYIRWYGDIGVGAEIISENGNFSTSGDYY